MTNIPKILTPETTDRYTVDQNTFVTKTKEFEIEVGDINQASFFPQVKIKRWNNEGNFSVRLIENEPDSPSVITEGGIIKWQKQKLEARFYDLAPNKPGEGGAYEFEVLLKEKPKSNKIQFSIQSKGLKFLYQPAKLTQLEIDRGAIRPDNVKGSYAVYHKTKRNHIKGQTNYKTGKAFHIYRPKITDANKGWVWGELNIDTQANILTITVPQTFLDNAVYPIVIDPTFGKTTLGGSTAADNGAVDAFSATPASSGTLDSISIGFTVAGDNVRLAIYDSTPSSLLEESASVAISLTGNWHTTSGFTQALTGSTQYWLALQVSGSTSWFYYDTGGSGTDNQWESQAYGAFPNPMTPTAGDWIGSIYGTYTAGGVTVSPSPASGIAAAIIGAVILGSVAVTPTPASAVASRVNPTIIQGNIVVTPSPTSCIAGKVDPTVKLGSLIIAPNPISCIASRAGPTVILGATSITPTPVDCIADRVNPAVVLGSISLTPQPAWAKADKVDPTVIGGGDVIVVPAPLSCIADRINPTVVLGSVGVIPTPAGCIVVASGPIVGTGVIVITKLFKTGGRQTVFEIGDRQTVFNTGDRQTAFKVGRR